MTRSGEGGGGEGPALLSPAYFSTFAHPTLVDTKKKKRNHSLDV